MSYTATAWAWAADLPCATKFVLVALADMADDKESCYPGQARLAKMTGQTDRSVRRHIEALESAGFLVRERRSLANGNRTSDRYVLQVTTGKSVLLSKPGQARGATGHSVLPENMTSGHMEQSLPDTVSRESLEESPVTPSLRSGVSGEAKKTTATAKRGHRLPDDWKPSEADMEWYRSQGHPWRWGKEHTDAFRDHWRSQPGARGMKLDWSATWRNWIRREAQRMPQWQRPTAPSAPAAVRAVDALAASEAAHLADMARHGRDSAADGRAAAQLGLGMIGQAV